MIAEMREMYPDVTIDIFNRNYAGPTVSFHQVKTYARGTELLRELGCDKRSKTTWGDTDNGRTTLEGVTGDIEVVAYIDELPPTCRIETVIERIPKQNTVDTGEFIEVSRRKVVCPESKTLEPADLKD